MELAISSGSDTLKTSFKVKVSCRFIRENVVCILERKCVDDPQYRVEILLNEGHPLSKRQAWPNQVDVLKEG